MAIERVFTSWLNQLYARAIDAPRRPVFYDIDTVEPALHKVTAAYPAIRAEFDALLGDLASMPAYGELDKGQSRIAGEGSGRWNVFLLEAFGEKPERNRARCPQTCAAVAKVPNVVQAFFSILDPGKSIPEHSGPYLGYLRYHLGLRVPETRPPTLFLNGIPYTWKEGEGVLFDDSWPHSVANDCPETRAVLIIDIRRPMPGFAGFMNRVATLIARYTYGRRVVRRAIAHGSTSGGVTA